MSTRLPYPNDRRGDAGSHRPKPPMPPSEEVASEFLAPAGTAAPRPTPAGTAADAHASPTPWTVSTLVTRIKSALTQAFAGRVTVVGEISNFKAHSSGHFYFRLKDASAAIDAAMFRGAASKVKFRPADGMEVIAEGRVDVYDARGQLQLYVESLTPKGAGALELAFRQLCQKLSAEGLFDPAHKVPIARFPRAIGLVTSPTGAAIRDISRTLLRRWPAATVYLAPAMVQGEGAAESIATALGLLDASAQRYQIDTIIVARGGGSLEDLWAFNEEAVARAIFACETPVISGVGHEVDTTIADMVADLRAPTPTGAAELAVPDRADMARHLAQLAGRVIRSAQQSAHRARQALAGCLRSVVFRDPAWRLRSANQRLDELSHRLRGATRHLLAQGHQRLSPLAGRLAMLHPARLTAQAAGRLDRVASRLAWALGGRSKRAGDVLAALDARLQAAHPKGRLEMASQRVASLARQLEAMSYRSALRRGFTVTRDADGKIIRAAGAVAPGSGLETEFVDGKVRSTAAGGPSDAAPAAPQTDAPAAPPAEFSLQPSPQPRPRRRKDSHEDEPSLF